MAIREFFAKRPPHSKAGKRRFRKSSAFLMGEGIVKGLAFFLLLSMRRIRLPSMALPGE
jgi:hypothetical protein